MQALQDAINLTTGANLANDGVFDDATREAVLGIQRFFKLAVDGIAEPQVKGLLISVLDRIASGAA